jgi:hypothetical protein
MIAIDGLGDTWLDLSQVEDNLPTSKQDNDAQQLQDTDHENHETTRIPQEEMSMGTMIKLGVVSHLQDFALWGI